MSEPSTPYPKVFVSYSWSSEDHISWVIEFSDRLVQDGVEVVLDQWDLAQGHDRYAFMEKMVMDPSIAHVLVVSDAEYARKADSKEGGVGTESQIISPEI